MKAFGMELFSKPYRGKMWLLAALAILALLTVVVLAGWIRDNLSLYFSAEVLTRAFIATLYYVLILVVMILITYQLRIRLWKSMKDLW